MSMIIKSSEIEAIISQYIGTPDKELVEVLSLKKTQSKSSNYHIISNLINQSLEIDNFKKHIKNLSVRTLQISLNNSLKEHLSLMRVPLRELPGTPWGLSEIKNYLEETTFLFVVFKDDGLNNKLYKVVVWKMDSMTLDTYCKEVYDYAAKLISEDNLKLMITKKGVVNNLPSTSFNGVAHFRPKAQSASDKETLLNGQRITKHGFWLNSGFIYQLINK